MTTIGAGMPRIRTLKPEHATHRKVGTLTDREYRLWVGMITQADDEGRLVWSTQQLRVLLFGYHPKVSAEMVEAAGRRLDGLGLIRIYSVNGKNYAWFPSWHEHQKISHPAPSQLPPYDDSVKPLESSGVFLPDRIKDQGSRIKEGIKDQGAADAAAVSVIDWLNQKTGRTYRSKGVNLELVKARLSDGIKPWQLRAIITRKAKEWGPDDRMRRYLRPETLFNKTKCEQYLGELPPVSEEAAP